MIFPGGNSDPDGKVTEPGVLRSIGFRIMHDEECQQTAAIEIRSSADLSSPMFGAGPNSACGTCGKAEGVCLGHAGVAHIPTTTMHTFAPNLVGILSLICFDCFRLCLQSHHIQWTLGKGHSPHEVVDLLKKAVDCGHCGGDRRHFKFRRVKSEIYMINSDGLRVPITPAFLFAALRLIPDSDWKLIGIAAGRNHPANGVIARLHVPSTVFRPDTLLFGTLLGKRAATTSVAPAAKRAKEADARWDSGKPGEEEERIPSLVQNNHLTTLIGVILDLTPAPAWTPPMTDRRVPWIRGTTKSTPHSQFAAFLVGRALESITVGAHGAMPGAIRVLSPHRTANSTKRGLVSRAQGLLGSLGEAVALKEDREWLALFMYLLCYADQAVEPQMLLHAKAMQGLSEPFRRVVGRIHGAIEGCLAERKAAVNALVTFQGAYDCQSQRNKLGRKSGLVRRHALGRRVGNSARTPVSNDTSMPTDCVGLPQGILDALRHHVPLQPFNEAAIQAGILDGTIDAFLFAGDTRPRQLEQLLVWSYAFQRGDVVFLSGKGRRVKVRDIRHARSILTPYHFLHRADEPPFQLLGSRLLPLPTLPYGTVCLRRPRKGDLVFINRQPSMYDTSMVALRVMPLPPGVHALTLNPVIQQGLRGDCDGDEINVFLPHKPAETVSEMELITPAKLLRNKMGKGCDLYPIHDVHLFLYLLTLSVAPGRPHMIRPAPKRPDQRICGVARLHGAGAWHGVPFECTGAYEFSRLLPPTLCYTAPPPDPGCRLPRVRVVDGVLVEGVVTGFHNTGSRQGLLWHIAAFYGDAIAIEYIDACQRLAMDLSHRHATTFSFRDLLFDMDRRGDIRQRAARALCAATEGAPASSEALADACQSVFEGVTMQAIAGQSLHTNPAAMINSRSKGSTVNLSHVVAPLGQQSMGKDGVTASPFAGGLISSYHPRGRTVSLLEADLFDRIVEEFRVPMGPPLSRREAFFAAQNPFGPFPTTEAQDLAAIDRMYADRSVPPLTGLLFSGERTPPRLTRAIRGNALFRFAKEVSPNECPRGRMERLAHQGLNAEGGFLAGLGPKHFIPAAFCARSALVQIVTKSSEIGYCIRNATQLTTDVHLAFNGTVRGNHGRVLQFPTGLNTDPAYDGGTVKFAEVLRGRMGL